MKPTCIAYTNMYVYNFQTCGFHSTFKINNMRMKTIILKAGIAFLFILFMGIGCESEKSGNALDLVKSVKDQKGFVWFEVQSKTYSVFVGIDGTYDCSDIGIPYNMPDEYKKEGLEILFSGNYYKCDDFPPRIPGVTYYYLELTEIKSVK